MAKPLLGLGPPRVPSSCLLGGVQTRCPEPVQPRRTTTRWREWWPHSPRHRAPPCQPSGPLRAPSWPRGSLLTGPSGQLPAPELGPLGAGRPAPPQPPGSSAPGSHSRHLPPALAGSCQTAGSRAAASPSPCMCAETPGGPRGREGAGEGHGAQGSPRRAVCSAACGAVRPARPRGIWRAGTATCSRGAALGTAARARSARAQCCSRPAEGGLAAPRPRGGREAHGCRGLSTAPPEPAVGLRTPAKRQGRREASRAVAEWGWPWPWGPQEDLGRWGGGGGGCVFSGKDSGWDSVSRLPVAAQARPWPEEAAERRVRGSEVPWGGVAVRAGALAVEGTGSSRSAVTLRGGDVARSWLEVGLQEWLRGLGRACDA